MSDILFKTEDFVFSYRVAGILVQEGKVLLQKLADDPRFQVDWYAFPGGHVSLGETNAETLIREFQEEIHADITVGDLKWVGEIFFPWGDKLCHQICLYYAIKLKGQNQIHLNGSFIGDEHFDGDDLKIEFHWVPMEKLNQISVCPSNAQELLSKYSEGVYHFIYKED